MLYFAKCYVSPLFRGSDKGSKKGGRPNFKDEILRNEREDFSERNYYLKRKCQCKNVSDFIP